MATKTFTTSVQLEGFIQSACAKAIKVTCERLLGTLQELIMSEFYDAYDNETYTRTFQFYQSAVTEMLTETSGMIFMNADMMNYPFSGRGWSWDGQTQLEAANQGVHGGWSTPESESHHFWDAFEKWCDENAIKILKEELVKQGIVLTR